MFRFRRLLTHWLPLCLWMMMIFSASGDRHSAEHSSRLIDPIVRWLFPRISERNLETVILGVRKCAHLAEYAILAILTRRALSPIAQPSSWSWRRATNVLLLVALYAVTDEFHQRFVPTREASVLDVLIDTLGGALGLLFAWILGRSRKLW